MVEDATKKIKETKGIILHSDQGWKYQNKEVSEVIKRKRHYPKHEPKRQLLR